MEKQAILLKVSKPLGYNTVQGLLNLTTVLSAVLLPIPESKAFKLFLVKQMYFTLMRMMLKFFFSKIWNKPHFVLAGKKRMLFAKTTIPSNLKYLYVNQF